MQPYSKIRKYVGTLEHNLRVIMGIIIAATRVPMIDAKITCCTLAIPCVLSSILLTVVFSSPTVLLSSPTVLLSSFTVVLSSFRSILSVTVIMCESDGSYPNAAATKRIQRIPNRITRPFSIMNLPDFSFTE